MILRNPASWRDSFFKGTITLLLSIVFPSATILHAQGIIGHVVESLSRQNIPQAEIGIYQQDSLLLQTTSDSSGYYSIHSDFAGRVSIRILSQDFQDYIQQDIILDGYSTIRLEHLLVKKAFDLPGITVVANKNRASDFVRSVDEGDMVLVAGNFEDPVRIAHSQPGIVQLNDQANHLSARGQSPVFNNWYLEGLQIVNPNHTSNAGTFSDLPTQYGGGVNMFSAQTLGSTDVYTGLGPLSVDHATGATINMHLHETAKPEWRAKAGLIGFELGGGTKCGNHGILDVNLRYSFTGLLTDLGADFGGEKIGFYDGVIAYTHQANQHKLKLFGWLGSSKNDFNQVQPPEDREKYKDFFDIHYGNDILGAGGRYDLTLSQKTFLRSGLAYSTDHSTYTKQGDETTFPENFQLDDKIAILSSFVEISTIHSDVWHSTFGFHYTSRAYEDDGNSDFTFLEESLGKIFIQSTFDLSPTFQLEMAGEVERSFKHDQFNGGYRVKLSKRFGAHHEVFAGIRQSAGDAVRVSFNDNDNVFFISRNIETGWEFSNGVQNIQFNAYFQHTYDLTVLVAGDVHYYLPDYPWMLVSFAIPNARDDGVANQYGVEGLWSMVPKKGWRVEVNQSVYKSERGIDGGEITGGRYDGRYATHVSCAKEIIKEKNGKNRIWNFSLRGLLNGGLWEPYIDSEVSRAFNKTIAVYPGLYEYHLPAYKRIDASISRTIATSKVRWQYKLDIQNLFGFTNIAYHYYDPFLDEIIAQKQLGIIPVLSVQASW